MKSIRAFLLFVSVAVLGGVGLALYRYGTLDPCGMLEREYALRGGAASTALVDATGERLGVEVSENVRSAVDRLARSATGVAARFRTDALTPRECAEELLHVWTD